MMRQWCLLEKLDHFSINSFKNQLTAYYVSGTGLYLLTLTLTDFKNSQSLS